MVVETRKRASGGFRRTGIQKVVFSPGGETSITKVPFVFPNREETTSENHPYWNRISQIDADVHSVGADGKTRFFARPAKNRDTGGPFTHIARGHWISHPNSFVFNVLSNPYREYKGPIAARYSNVGTTDSQWPAIPAHSASIMNALGTKAIALTLPTNPAAHLATALGELKNDGLPKIPTAALVKAVLGRYRLLGSLSNEYLNLVFGWAPLINDVRELAFAVQNSDVIIEQFIRDSGRPIRRRLHFPTVRTTTTSLVSTNTLPVPGFHGSQVLSTGKLEKETTTVTKSWFSACYTYWLDPGIDARGKLKRQEQIAHKLLGARVNPEVLWELTPWSWAIDWVTNVGDITTNISALLNDSLCIRWAYVMMETTITDTYTLTGCRLRGVPEGAFIQKFWTKTQSRVKATPYGFGLDPASFTSQQKAIILALGISRSQF
jgi:hypothetical protein